MPKLRTRGEIQALNQPRPLRVGRRRDGSPRVVERAGQAVAVEQIRDCWRIDDRWWTETPVSRTYYELELVDGDVLTVFLDQVAGDWYEQRVSETLRPAPPHRRAEPA